MIDDFHTSTITRGGTTDRQRTKQDKGHREQLVRFVTWFKERPKDQRRDRHRKPPTMPIPWGQRPV